MAPWTIVPCLTADPEEQRREEEVTGGLGAGHLAGVARACSGYVGYEEFGFGNGRG